MSIVPVQGDRDAAWPFRPEGYGPRDLEAWNAGRYDVNRIIQAFAKHRLDSTAELVAALGNTLALARLKFDNLDAGANAVFEQAEAALAAATNAGGGL